MVYCSINGSKRSIVKIYINAFFRGGYKFITLASSVLSLFTFNYTHTTNWPLFLSVGKSNENYLFLQRFSFLFLFFLHLSIDSIVSLPARLKVLRFLASWWDSLPWPFNYILNPTQTNQLITFSQIAFSETYIPCFFLQTTLTPNSPSISSLLLRFVGAINHEILWG